jgi:hypothetical protein
MKKLFSLTLLCLSLVVSWAQSYQHFAIEGAHWNMTEHYCPCDPINLFPFTQTDYCFKFVGDTLVDSLTYKKIFESFTQSYSPYNYVTYQSSSNWLLIGLVREDTLSEKVFIRGITGCYPQQHGADSAQ